MSWLSFWGFQNKMGTIFMPSILIFKLEIKNGKFFVDIWAYKFKYFEFLKYTKNKDQ